MKKIFLVLFFFYPIFCAGQNQEIEKLVNEAAKIIVPTDFRYYNLIDSSFVIDVSRLTGYNPLLNRFISNNPDFLLSDFLSQSNELERINWQDYKIDSAHLYSYTDIPKFQIFTRTAYIISSKTPKAKLDSLNRNKKYDEIIVPVKKWWSRGRINKEVEKKWQEWEDDRERNTILENRKYFLFSTPLFSFDNKYAIMQLIDGEGGRICVFKQEKENWIYLDKIYGYVY